MSLQKQPFAVRFYKEFAEPELSFKTDLRWWMAAGRHTDETLRTELQAMYNAGFSGVELCQLADKNIDASVYGYGSAQWENDVKLLLNTALDLGMSVSLTCGAGWASANVPGLDPDSQAANQCVMLLTEELPAGSSRSGALPTSEELREKRSFVGAVAVRKVGDMTYEAEVYVMLTPLVQNGTLEWTAPMDGDYTLMYYFAQARPQENPPAVETSYTINYFDRRGMEVLQHYLEENVLNDAALIEKIKTGDVQYFMDSLEYQAEPGITSWTENFPQDFFKYKGYDILPYLYVAADAPNTNIWDWHDNADLQGRYYLTDRVKNKQILDDIYDVQTKLYMEEFINPFRKWLNSYGITLRVQISYGKNLEISEPIAVVDRPESENRNQNNQVDLYRLWSGGAHLQNKVLSAETGGLDSCGYFYSYQRHLQEAYSLYAAGFARIVWHIWCAEYGPKPVWPGYEGGDHMDAFYKFGLREPSYSDYPLFNDHLGRVQKLLRSGKAGVDIGMIYHKYGQRMVYGDAEDWMHTHRPMFFPSTVLQDNGYTYDYLSPAFLDAEGVSYDREKATLELAGYKALVLWHGDLPVSGAKRILELAKEGLPVVIVEGAAVVSTYYNDSREELTQTVSCLKRLPNVRTVSCADQVLDALRDLGISPYVGFAAANQQLLTQIRRDGDNRYLFVYNYCDESLHTEDNIPHGQSITTELVADGVFAPYAMDPWTGKVSKVAARYVDGKTVFSLTLDYGDVAMYGLEALEAVPEEEVLPAVKTGDSFEITDWILTVEAWEPSDELLTRSETLLGVTTEEYTYKTAKRTISVQLEKLATWDKVDAIGKAVSGKGFYRAKFFWDGNADGAYLDFGRMVESLRVTINGVETDPVNMNVPKVDISQLLCKGENTIQIEYSSNLGNLQMSRGKVKKNWLVNKFPGYVTKYESYGPPQAVVVPYFLT